MLANCFFCALNLVPLHSLLTFLGINTNFFNPQFKFLSSSLIETIGVLHGNKSNTMPTK